ncbi:TetR/AcrR family transcriptional regulator [Kribbella sp. NPDC023855]|uniref:TetR/AcrR family transcriptional regulator n=1 Tax=Kribbella sp. NPDC023855 TaxID=3154698 RepID=UPI0033F29DB4
MPARTKAQQREETTATLVAAARELFADKGYGQVSLAEIVDAAGVTKGALYHYFDGKDALFQAVLEQVHAEVAERIEQATEGLDSWQQLVVGCRTFLTASAEPHRQQIMLIDAPAVLGWGTWRRLDASTSMQQLIDVLNRLVDEGEIARQPVVPLAHLLSGAMNEAALWLAGSDHPRRDLKQTLTALTGLLESLRT